MSRKQLISLYFIKNFDDIIESINFSFIPTNENFILSVFSENELFFINVNTNFTKNFSNIFENEKNYINYLLLFGIFAILIRENFQIEKTNDSKITHIKDFLKDLTYNAYFNKKINLNNIFFDDELLYFYGKKYVISVFRQYYLKNIELCKALKLLGNLNENDFFNIFHKLKYNFKIKDEL